MSDLKNFKAAEPFDGLKVRDILRLLGERKICPDDIIVTRSSKEHQSWDKFESVTEGYGIVILEVKK